MKLYLRLIALLITLMTLASLFEMVAFSEEHTQLTNEIEFIKTILKVDADIEIDEKAEVSRGEFAVYIGKILHLDGSNKTFSNIFNDVDETANGAYEIYMLSKMGIFNGYANGIFGYDEIVTNNQAIKVIVTILGYEQDAQSKGGWPTGYLIKSRELGLPISSLGDAKLTYGDLCKLLHKAVNVDIKQAVSFGDDAQLAVKKGETLLSNILKIERVKNVRITGTNVTKLSEKSDLLDDEVEVAGIKYFKGDTNVAKYLGYVVDIYYQKKANSDDKTIIYIEEKGNKNDVVAIDAIDIESYENGILSYSKYDKTVNKIISNGADFVYNGVAIGYNADMFTLAEGNITLVDTNSDSEFDVVFIDECVNILVGQIDYENKIIYDKYDYNKVVDLESTYDTKYDIVSVGEDEQVYLDINELSTGDFISVFKSTDGDYVKIYLNDNVVDGVISELSEDTIVIDNVVYKRAIQQALKVGSVGSFYVDFYGKVMSYDLSTVNGMKYAYLIAVDDKGYIDAKVKIKIFDQFGMISTPALLEHTKLNGESLQLTKQTDLNKICDKFKTDPRTGVISTQYVPQLLRCSVDEAGRITKIDTVAVSPINENDELSIYWSKASLIYKSYIKSFNMNFNIDDTTVIFSVPQDSTNTDDYKILKTSAFTNDSYYNVEAYSADDVALAKVLINWSSASPTPNADAPLTIFDKTTTTVDTQGDVKVKVYAISNGKYISLNAADSSVLSVAGRRLERGDVIRYSTNYKGEINAVALDYDITKKYVVQNLNNVLTINWNYNGTIYSYENGYSIIANEMKQNSNDVDFNTKSKLITYRPQGYIYIYNEKTDKVSIGNLNDLKSYKIAATDASRVLLRFRYETCKEIVIFEYTDS